jgi:hypothetical protein
MPKFEGAEHITVQIICGYITVAVFYLDEFDAVDKDGYFNVSNWTGAGITIPNDIEWTHDSDAFEDVWEADLGHCKVRLSWDK